MTAEHETTAPRTERSGQRPVGPDAARYLLAGRGERVARPFHLRWAAPWLCRDDLRRWWALWAVSWPAMAGGMVTWALASELELWRALAAAGLLLGLPGVLGPPVARPVGVDLPALALGVWAVAFLELGWWPAAVAAVLAAGCVKETASVFAALWAWHPLLLVGLVAPAVRAMCARPAIDQVTALTHLRAVHDHPVRTALAARRGRWRDAWLMVAPWGVCLAALVDVDVRLAAVLVVAHLQLLVATDTVRLVHTAAGPPLALTAATVLPTEWLVLAVVVHIAWWRQPELV